MTGKELGKIVSAKFGIIDDYPFLMGLQLEFVLGSGGGVGTGATYTVNISPECRWEESERRLAIVKMVMLTNEILREAKVLTVDKLVGRPVEVTIEGNMFKDFRILTEVI